MTSTHLSPTTNSPHPLTTILPDLTTHTKADDDHHSRYDRSDRINPYLESEKSFACDLCGDTFVHGRGLHAHKRRTHLIKHPLTSLVTISTYHGCSRTFTDLQGARQHFRKAFADKITHSGKKQDDDFRIWRTSIH